MSPTGTACLLIAIGTGICAVPVAHVVETMRPLPSEPVAGMPPFVLGLSMIRGAPVPVIDLASLLGTRRAAVSRFVTLRLGERQAALAVESVLGCAELGGVEELPPLLQQGSADVVEAIGILDTKLLLVLRASRLLPEDVWRRLESRGAPS